MSIRKSGDSTRSQALIVYQIERWIDSYSTTPNEMDLDIDSTDDPAHGKQQLVLFHGDYDQYMYHLIILGCGGNVFHMLT